MFHINSDSGAEISQMNILNTTCKSVSWWKTKFTCNTEIYWSYHKMIIPLLVNLCIILSRWNIQHLGTITEIRQHTVPSKVLQGQVYWHKQLPCVQSRISKEGEDDQGTYKKQTHLKTNVNQNYIPDFKGTSSSLLIIKVFKDKWLTGQWNPAIPALQANFFKK